MNGIRKQSENNNLLSSTFTKTCNSRKKAMQGDVFMHAFVTTQMGFDLRGQSSRGATDSDVPDA